MQRGKTKMCQCNHVCKSKSKHALLQINRDHKCRHISVVVSKYRSAYIDPQRALFSSRLFNRVSESSFKPLCRGISIPVMSPGSWKLASHQQISETYQSELDALHNPVFTHHGYFHSVSFGDWHHYVYCKDICIWVVNTMCTRVKEEGNVCIFFLSIRLW